MVMFALCFLSFTITVVNGFNLLVEETQIRHMSIATIPMVGKEYSISLDVKPTSFEPVWNSVVHFRTEGEESNKDRIKGVWFSGGDYPDRLHICSPNYGDDTFCHTTVARFASGEWINIRLTQERYHRRYMFKIYINGEEIYSVRNRMPRVFRNVKVHAGDRWYAPQPGYFRKLTFTMRCPRSIIDEEVELQSGRLYGVLREVKENFRVSFDLQLSAIKPMMASVVQLSVRNSNEGDRGYWIPAVFTTPGQDMFKVCSDNVNELNRCVNTQWGYRLDRWVNVKIIQSLFGSRYLMKILFNGEEIHSIENTHPESYRTVNIYASSPDHEPAAGSIRNLEVDGKCPPHVVPPEIIDRNPDVINPVDGGWAAWSSYGTCTATCGGGRRIRTRSCEDPEPQNNGLDCRFSDGTAHRGLTERQWEVCGDTPCPVGPRWSSWSDYTNCTVPCGGGTRTRSRTCSNPAAGSGEATCRSLQGNLLRREVQTSECRMGQCPASGQWSNWSSFTICTIPCGGGNRTRSRTCSNPTPSGSGNACRSIDGRLVMHEEQTEECRMGACPVSGRWSSWGPHSICTKTCGGGTREKTRTCSNPAPQQGGSLCLDLQGNRASRETQQNTCNAQPCPVNGNWGPWSGYGECSVTCGRGLTTRFRSCSDPSASNGGLQCLNSDGVRRITQMETEPCTMRDCPGSKRWHDNLRCGGSYPLPNLRVSECNPSGDYPCCSPRGWCGNTAAHCTCPTCIDYSKPA